MSHYMILLFLLFILVPQKSIQVDVAFNTSLKPEDLEPHGGTELNCLLMLTNSSSSPTKAYAFYNSSIQFKNQTSGSVLSFSTIFSFAMEPKCPSLRAGHGISFVISSSRELQGVPPSQYLVLFNATTMGNSSNLGVTVELDTFQDYENGHFKNLTLKSGEQMHVWLEYDGTEKQLNVTLSPGTITQPHIPLLSLTRDLSPFLLDCMYVGFSFSIGHHSSAHCISGWSFRINGPAQELDCSHLPKPPYNTAYKAHSRIQKILPLVLPLTGGTFFVIVIFGALKILRRKKFMEVLEDWEVQYGPQCRFTYEDLYAATKGFKETELLGRGGFGKVYRGVLPTSSTQVAVKRVDHDSRQGMRQFVAEIATTGRLRHPDLVPLLGYCRCRRELLLVYDYMPNGSLDKFIFGQPKQTLNWSQRFKIIKDVASGIFYLHHQWLQVVIHRDIKASNVLLDSEMKGRLGDFGLAELYDHGNDPQTSRVAGTHGYIAPELARTGKANTSTDLFAFGAFMLEVVCGRRPVEPRASPEEITLVNWVFKCWERGVILETIDRRLENEYVEEEAVLVLKLGLLCSHALAAARPSMSTVVQYLKCEAPLPDNLSFIIENQDFHEGSNQQIAPQISVRSLTITDSFIYNGR